MIILIHSSKTMRLATKNAGKHTRPELINKAHQLNNYLKALKPSELQKLMSISEDLSKKTQKAISDWSDDPKQQIAAADCFLGDIYSGLQVKNWSKKDREYAQEHLRILSGLYGVLKPLDGIKAYRLEMAYRLPNLPYKNLYDFWGDSIAKTLPKQQTIINLAAAEYSKTILQYIDKERFVTPSFQTVNSKTSEPSFVTVHAKIARGAFANWMIRNRIENINKLKEFNEIGYKYNSKLSTPIAPVFVCRQFGGIGLSMRLT